MIKTFRGLLADGGQDRIRLGTIKGKVGYKIIKFKLLSEKPGAVSQESVVKIYKTEQGVPAGRPAIDGEVDFTDSDLLASGIYILSDNSTAIWNTSETIIFDSEIFNQDIYITHSDISTGQKCNYYFELEVIPLDDAGAEYTTIKDLRSNA